MRQSWSIEFARQWVRSQHRASRPFTSVAAPVGLRKHVERKLGRWSALLDAVGLSHGRSHPRWHYWSPATVLKEIRARVRSRKPLGFVSVEQDVGRALLHQAVKHFGSWDAALEAAGVDPGRVRTNLRWSPERVLREIAARRARGLSMRRCDVEHEHPRLVSAAERHVARSWDASCRLAAARRRW